MSWKVQNEKFCAKIRSLKFGPKKPFLSILDWNLKKLMSYLKSTPSSLNNDNSNNKTWNQKCFIWVFWPVDLKNCCYIWNQHPRICQNAKFGAKIEIQNKTKKVTLMQSWKSANIFVLIWKYVEDLTLKHFVLF